MNKLIEKIAYILYKANFLNKPLLLVRIFRVFINNIFLKKEFIYNWTKFKYFNHEYNATYANERKIEVPIIKYYIEKNKWKILEIWNVLSHYYNTNHYVVDKYEKDNYKNLINKDIIEFNSDNKYDLIVSISTFEHVWFDEIPQEKEKILKALIHVYNNLLSNNWTLLITVPFWYNDFLDNLIKEKKLNELFNDVEIKYLKKISNNYWEEVNSVKDIFNYTYWKYYNCANSICIIKINK